MYPPVPAGLGDAGSRILGSHNCGQLRHRNRVSYPVNWCLPHNQRRLCRRGFLVRPVPCCEPDQPCCCADLECQHLHKALPISRVVSDVSFSIPSAFVLSPFSALRLRQTHLLRHASGFLEADSGDIRIQGQSICWASHPTKRP